MKTTKIFFILLAVLVLIFLLSIFVKIPVQYDILELNSVFPFIAIIFIAIPFFQFPVFVLEMLSISWREPGCAFICFPSVSAMIFMLIFDLIILYIFSIAIAYSVKLFQHQ